MQRALAPLGLVGCDLELERQPCGLQRVEQRLVVRPQRLHPDPAQHTQALVEGGRRVRLQDPVDRVDSGLLLVGPAG